MKWTRSGGLVGLFVSLLSLSLASCGGEAPTDNGTVEQTSDLRAPRRRPPPPPPPAQTPDGRAIPQPAGPNGQCPAVVVLLGFWSCPTINQTCTSGALHCVCTP